MTDEEKAKMPKITKELVFRALKYLKPYWKQLIVVITTITLSSVLGLFPSIITGKIIDDGFNGKNFNILVELILISFSVVVGSNLINVLQSYVNTWMSQHIVFDMKNEMYRHLEYMAHKFFTNEKQGEIITRMTGDITGVQSVISGTLTSIFSNVLVLITTAVALYSKNWILATIGILIVPLFILPTKKVGKRRFDLATQTQAKYDEINQVLNETLSVSGSLLVKIFTKEDIEYNKYTKINGDITKLAIKESIIGRWFQMSIGVFTNMGPMLIYLVAGILMLKFGNTSLTIGGVTMMVTLINRLYGPVNSLFNLQIDVTRSMALFKRIFDYFDLPNDITNKPNAVVIETIKGDIEFENVNFHYTEEMPILKNVSFKIDSGQTIAIVGPSGAGKSTIINLIPRLYDTISGSVKIDGLDVKDADMFSLRKHIGFVTQDTYLFNGTVRANLLYANEEATEEQLIDACKRAYIHDYIDSLPEKYETIVGNRGLKLSGGEKQRLSIARVILKDPKILILDEATSSLDSISESLIQQAIDPLLKNRTSVVIAHRLSTIMAADEIIVLEKGEIAERGTHAELVETSGVYKELYETQFRRAIEDMQEREEHKHDHEHDEHDEKTTPSRGRTAEQARHFYKTH
ncbi:MAG: ABC transporter ATP-binding protein/permease [Oscillospiraceae bacterium]|nr:ABC transporter ATP-binding protein/permease [Oscillospiraceae bacterium]